MFLVVEFTDTNEVDVVPSLWMQDQEVESYGNCYWPSYKTTDRLLKAKLAHEQPRDSWTQYAVEIIYGPTGRVQHVS